MKEMALNNDVVNESVNVDKQDRLEIVLAESERILNRVNERLDRIDERQKQIEIKAKQLEGIQYFIKWKLEKEGVIHDGRI
ncbi:hypothetical protein [Heyndrickxia sporothermodurans]|uniref:hypothetical protein n=1 Tax=Heyndrickxia sporothermodurans TaxID=46224 RepID=UPI0035DFF154